MGKLIYWLLNLLLRALISEEIDYTDLGPQFVIWQDYWQPDSMKKLIIQIQGHNLSFDRTMWRSSEIMFCIFFNIITLKSAVNSGQQVYYDQSLKKQGQFYLLLKNRLNQLSVNVEFPWVYIMVSGFLYRSSLVICICQRVSGSQWVRFWVT